MLYHKPGPSGLFFLHSTSQSSVDEQYCFETNYAQLFFPHTCPSRDKIGFPSPIHRHIKHLIDYHLITISTNPAAQMHILRNFKLPHIIISPWQQKKLINHKNKVLLQIKLCLNSYNIYHKHNQCSQLWQSKKNEIYLTPSIHAVEFKVEMGLELSGFTQREEDTGKYELIGDPDDQSSMRETWGTFN